MEDPVTQYITVICHLLSSIQTIQIFIDALIAKGRKRVDVRFMTAA